MHSHVWFYNESIICLIILYKILQAFAHVFFKKKAQFCLCLCPLPTEKPHHDAMLHGGRESAKSVTRSTVRISKQSWVSFYTYYGEYGLISLITICFQFSTKRGYTCSNIHNAFIINLHKLISQKQKQIWLSSVTIW